MSIDAQLHEAAGSEVAGRAYPDDWWQSRSSDELREFINRGFAGGDLFAGATAEAARRSSEAQRAAQEDAAVASVRLRRKTRKLLLLRALVLISLLATLFTLVVVVMHLGE